MALIQLGAAAPIRSTRVRRWSVAVVVASLAMIVSWIQPRFVSFENLTNVVRQSSFAIIFALAQMVPILARGFDLSQGGVIVVTSVAFALFANAIGIPLAVVGALLIAALIGSLNGLLVARFSVSPFVATLGVGFALQGASLLLSGGQPVTVSSSNFSYLAWGSVVGVPIPALFAGMMFLALNVTLTKTVIGRYLYAIGSNDRAALLCGIAVKPLLVAAYMTCAVLTAVGSMLLSSRINSGHPTVGIDAALGAIAAVVVGGVSLAGGRGSPVGVCVAAILLTLLGNSLNLLNISSYVQQVTIGAAIIVAVVLDGYRTGRRM